ncbi:MAG: hypothetical protein EAZ30_10635 [Betaproteobacteria bacterium]|nr:MAG: hypothetical protein EAZ30_10635 [Betaproteobacteria bacterium]
MGHIERRTRRISPHSKNKFTLRFVGFAKRNRASSHPHLQRFELFLQFIHRSKNTSLPPPQHQLAKEPTS